MIRTFKPNVEHLEDRRLMSTVTEELYGNFHFLPTVPTKNAEVLAVRTDAADYSAIAFVGGWGASSYQYAFSGTYANSDVLGNTYYTSGNGGVSKTAIGGDGRDVLLGGSGVDRLLPDDVWVDGKIIIGENPSDSVDLSNGDPGHSEAVGGNIDVYFHVIHRSSIDQGHGTHVAGTIGAEVNASADYQHEVGHWMGLATFESDGAVKDMPAKLVVL